MLFFTAFSARAAEPYPNITVLKPEKLNFINEPALPISANTSLHSNTVCSTANENNTNEICNMDLDIPTAILFSEEEKISIYNKPDAGAEKIAFIEPPAEVRIIKLSGNFAKIRISNDQAGWILKRNIQTQDFNKLYQEKINQFLSVNLNTDTVLVNSANIQNNP